MYWCIYLFIYLFNIYLFSGLLKNFNKNNIIVARHFNVGDITTKIKMTALSRCEYKLVIMVSATSKCLDTLILLFNLFIYLFWQPRSQVKVLETRLLFWEVFRTLVRLKSVGVGEWGVTLPVNLFRLSFVECEPWKRTSVSVYKVS